MHKILLYAYGNPGRQDDGLGNSFIDIMAEWIKEQEINHVFTDSNYQLNIEDAEVISNYDEVYFVDASLENIDSFIITEVSPSDAKIEFSMHAVSSAYILDLCNKIYHKTPKTFLIHIKGYEWDFQEGITYKALSNLERTVAFMKEKIIAELN